MPSPVACAQQARTRGESMIRRRTGSHLTQMCPPACSAGTTRGQDHVPGRKFFALHLLPGLGHLHIYRPGKSLAPKPQPSPCLRLAACLRAPLVCRVRGVHSPHLAKAPQPRLGGRGRPACPLRARVVACGRPTPAEGGRPQPQDPRSCFRQGQQALRPSPSVGQSSRLARGVGQEGSCLTGLANDCL